MENIELVELCMRPLAHLGCRFALDDFGTGYSSFLQLQRLPISTIKVDKQFIDDMATKKQDASLVQAMIQLAHSLGKTVIAEGVEAPAQSVLLDQFGCDESQGFYFCKPIELVEVEQHFSPALLAVTPSAPFSA
jgi:EAL domain-containing protein (putative c-di-GMP-specific phosphodiesterase class I)